MCHAKVAGPPWARTYPRSELRGCLMRKWPDHLGAGHLRGQGCEDVSGESGLNTSTQGVSEPRIARMSQAKVAGPPWGRASRNPEFRGCLRQKRPDHHGAGHLRGQTCEDVLRKWPEHLSSGHLRDQTCEDVSCESGWTTMGQGISEVTVVRTPYAKVV